MFVFSFFLFCWFSAYLHLSRAPIVLHFTAPSHAALHGTKPRSLLDKAYFGYEDGQQEPDSTGRALLYLYPNNFLVDTTTAADYERVIGRDDLESNCLYILVTAKRLQLYAWIGRNFNPPGGEPQEQFALDALKAFQKLHPQLFANVVSSNVKHTVVNDSGGGGSTAATENFWTELDASRV